LNRASFWSLDVLRQTPPIAKEGAYCFAAGLTTPGTFDFVSDISFADFEIIGSSSGSEFHVNADTGDDTGDGSQAAPFKTIAHALASVEGSEENPVTIHAQAELGPCSGYARAFASCRGGSRAALNVAFQKQRAAREPPLQNTDFAEGDAEATEVIATVNVGGTPCVAS